MFQKLSLNYTVQVFVWVSTSLFCIFLYRADMVSFYFLLFVSYFIWKFVQELEKIIEVFIGQLRLLFGLNSNYVESNPIFKFLASEKGFTDWWDIIFYIPCSHSLSLSLTAKCDGYFRKKFNRRWEAGMKSGISHIPLI